MAIHDAVAVHGTRLSRPPWREPTQAILRRTALLALLCFSSAGPVLAQTPPASPAATLFEKTCYSCHNIGGGDKKGPDLMGVGQRRSREWLHKFIPSPQALRASGDPTAIDLFKKYAPEEMPDQLLTPAQIDEILAMIEDLTARNATFMPQSGQLARPVVPSDIPAGYKLFVGETPLQNGGPSCISCHSVQGVGALSGGTLGPDLTAANIKYTDVELASILKAPAFPTMSKVFLNHELTDEEVVQVFAYLQNAKTRTPDPARGAMGAVLLGTLGALVSFGLMSFVWRNRFHGVRKAMVENANERARANAQKPHNPSDTEP